MKILYVDSNALRAEASISNLPNREGLSVKHVTDDFGQDFREFFDLGIRHSPTNDNVADQFVNVAAWLRYGGDGLSPGKGLVRSVNFTNPLTTRDWEEVLSLARARNGKELEDALIEWGKGLVTPQELASWTLWKQAEALGIAGGKTRPACLPQDGSEILKDQYRTLAKALSHTPAEWDGLDLACAEVLLKAVNRASVGAT